MFDVLWSPGRHSLCAQVNGSPFKAIGQFEDPQELLDAASRLPEEANVWWGVHGMDAVARGRGGSDDVVAVTCLAADFDWADPDAHKGTTLPLEFFVRSAVARMEPEPTVIVNSGHGLQVYWGLVHEIGPAEAQDLSDGFFRYIEAEYELHNDRIDLASVLRLPGTLNNKSTPVEVLIEENNGLGWDAEFLRQNFWYAPKAPQVPSPATVPVAFGVGQLGGDGFVDEGESPFDWLNRTFDSFACLLRLGWTKGHERGDEVQFTRPGKDPRHGTSATWHQGTGAVNIYSTALDPIYTAIGLAGRGCVTLKPADLWMVENGVTDRSTASRMIRQMMPQGAGAAAIQPPPHTVQGAEAVETTAGLNLPDEFWTRRGWLAQIRQACDSRGASADAVLGCVIARYATTIPPQYRIPAIIQTESTFDHISILAAESAGGKSGAMGLAKRLFPGPQERKDIVWGWPVSSGEGLVSAFFEMVEKEVNGKKTMVNAKTKTAVYFSVDESLGLIEVAGRSGATIGSVLCTAWSGGNPGQGNASADRKRVGMDEGTYRMAGVAGIQMSLGHRFMEDVFVQQGLSGRLVFFAAEDPGIVHPDDRPEWPGPLDLPVHPTMPVEMSYAPEIERQIRLDNWSKMTKRTIIAPIDGHLNLVRLKLAGIFALMDGRTAVTVDDWELTEILLRSHIAIRNQMLATKRQHQYEKTVTAATAQAAFEDVKEAARERQAVASLRDTILRRIPEEGITRSPLRKLTTNTRTKHRFDTALIKAMDDGKLELRGDRYFLI